MKYGYPCLYNYIGEEFAKAILAAAIFSEIKTESGNIFIDYDTELLSEMGMQFYFETNKLPLKTLYFLYCEQNVDWEDDESITNFYKHIAKVAYARFGENWEKVYKAYFVDTYNPLENYDMTQTRTPLLDTTSTHKRKQETIVDTSGKTSIVPFNSVTPVETGESEGKSTTTEEKAKNEIENKVEERGSDTLTRHGNIGVMSSQKLLSEEVEVRKLDFWKLIYHDLGKILYRNYVSQCGPWPL